MLNKLATLNRSAGFWLLLMLFAMGMLGMALFYQYVLGTLPCVLCVQIRAWVTAILLLAVLGLFLRHSRVGVILSNFLVLLASLAFAERAYVTLGTERGFVEGTCGMNPHFPAWLKLDDWLPAVYKPLESCGYTPWVIPDMLTMAEALMLVAVLLVLLMAVMLVTSLFSSK